MHFPDILNLAARAWHEIKPTADPEFNDCALTHRENLGAAAKGVVDSGQAFSHFERVVLRLHQEAQAAKSEVERILEQHPTAHADEVMHIASGVPHPLQTPAALAASEVVDAARASGFPFSGHAENAQMAATREEFKGADSEPFALPPSAFPTIPTHAEAPIALEPDPINVVSDKEN